MRELILLGGAALALCGCGREQSAEERAAAERNVTSEVVATNDVTAIDAATGQAANMAADVDYMPELENALGNGAEANGGATRTTNTAAARPRPRTPERRRPATADRDEPDTNTL